MYTKIFLYVVLLAFGAEPQLTWIQFQPPEYPRNAQITHIQGTVILKFTLQTGNRVAVQSSVGHPLLIPSALDSLGASKLACDNCSKQSTLFTVTYDFEVANHDCNEPDRPTRVTKDSPTHIKVIAQSVCTSDPVVRYMKARSFRCLYLWKCGRRPE